MEVAEGRKFAVPHCTVAYVLWRRPERFASAAARMYAVFDLGAGFYWAIPTAPPWYAARDGVIAPVIRASARGWIWLRLNHAGNLLSEYRIVIVPASNPYRNAGYTQQQR